MPEPTPQQPPQAPPPEAPKPPAPDDADRYRRRALSAESRAQQLEQNLADLKAQAERRSDELAAAEAQRDEAQHQLALTQNRSLAERMLAEAGVVDVETAALLLGRRVDLAEEADGRSLSRHIEELILDKPFLRSPAGTLPPASAAARPTAAGAASRVIDAAERAARSGDRRDVAEYLRLRRKAASRQR